jgi:hypothetical protein
MSRMVLNILTITGIGAIAVVISAVWWFMKHRTTEDAEKIRLRRDKKLASAAESLEQIANDMDEWTRQQREKFKDAKIAFRKKWISRWFSDYFIMELFRDTVHRRRFGDILDTFRLYMPNIFESLKEIRHNFLNGAKFMKKVEMQKDKAENGHDLGFWCINFLDETARPTVKNLRNAAEKIREYLTAQKHVKTGQGQPKEMFDKQVEPQAAQKQAKTRKEQPKEILNKQVDLQTVQKQAKTVKEQPKEILNKQVGPQAAQKQAKTRKEQLKKMLSKQVDLRTARKQAKTRKEQLKKMLSKQVDLQTAQKQPKTGKELPKRLLNKRADLQANQKPAKTVKEQPKEILDKQVDLQTARKQAKTVKEQPKEILSKQVNLHTSQKKAKTVEERPKGLLNKQVGILLQSSPDISASEIVRILNKNYAGVYKPISPCAVGKTENWKKRHEKIVSCVTK